MRRALGNVRTQSVPAPPGVVMVSPITRSRATLAKLGLKAKVAFSNRGGLEQRGKQHTNYKGRDALKHNSEPDHLGSCMAFRGGAMQEFSEVRTVASRNSLYQILAINVAVRGMVEG
jgi:hypothetical protein